VNTSKKASSGSGEPHAAAVYHSEIYEGKKHRKTEMKKGNDGFREKSSSEMCERTFHRETIALN
jgi:hypothetical protein